MQHKQVTEWRNLNINDRFRVIPSSRWGHAMVATEDSVYIIGGYDGKSPLSLLGNYLHDIWKFDFRSFRLIELNINLPRELKRSNQTAVYYPKDKR